MAIMTCLAASLALISGGHSVDTAANLKFGVEWVLHFRQVPNADKPAVREALLKAAKADAAVYNAILFTGEAGTLLQKSAIYGGYAPFLEQTMLAWEGLAALGHRYVPGGILSGIRYRIGEREDPSLLKDDDDLYISSPEVNRLQVAYAGLRRLGIRSDMAWKRLSDTFIDELSMEGFQTVRVQLQGLGEWALTGYDAADAERDLPAYFEAWYAYRHRTANDIKAVVPAGWPSMFIGNKLELAMRRDVGHMLVPVDRVIDATEERIDHKAQPQPPKPSTAVPTKLSLFPNSAWVKAPGANTPPEPYAYVIDELTTEGYGIYNSDYSEADAGIDGKKFEITKFLATGPVPPGQHRGGHLTITRSSSDGSSRSLRPNANYDLIFYPWYWAPKVGGAFFVQGDLSRNAWDQIQNPPAQGRVIMPASKGEPFTVHVRVHADGAGRIELLFGQPGLSAISLGPWYLKQVP
ncbi:MAG: hypothetical protein ACYC96_15675 [Fimbriimonadaceae bacterium]